MLIALVLSAIVLALLLLAAASVNHLLRMVLDALNAANRRLDAFNQRHARKRLPPVTASVPPCADRRPPFVNPWL